MGVKFIKHMEVDGKEIRLDITQENTPGGIRCFRIDVCGDQSFDFLLCKNSEDEWQVITQAFPEFIIGKLFDHVTSALEERLMLEKSYMMLN